MEKIYNYFEKLNKENKFGHAFLIGNVQLKECKKEIESVLSDFVFLSPIDMNSNPNIYIIEPEGNLIRRDQIAELLNNISTTSQSYGKKAYIISECENLSETVYNRLLKTIEEPEDNIIAFLLSGNIDAVAETIRSRCQIVFVSSNMDEKKDEKTYEMAKDVLRKIEDNTFKCIGLNSEIYNLLSSRELLLKVIKEMSNVYKDELYYKIGMKDSINYNSFTNASINELCRKILSINNIIGRENINVNKDIMIDKLIIELWRSKNEDCFDRI